MKRKTKKQLRETVAMLNKRLGLPMEAYTRTDAGLETNAGHLTLDVNSPGDGWTRYRLNVMCEKGGESEISSSCNSAEMSAYLEGFHDCLDHFDKHHALETLCASILTWARTPGNHGGNPYTHEFVQLAEKFSGGKQ